MKVVCVNDVVVNGFIVYTKGYEYDLEKHNNGSLSRNR